MLSSLFGWVGGWWFIHSLDPKLLLQSTIELEPAILSARNIPPARRSGNADSNNGTQRPAQSTSNRRPVPSIFARVPPKKQRNRSYSSRILLPVPVVVPVVVVPVVVPRTKNDHSFGTILATSSGSNQ